MILVTSNSGTILHGAGEFVSWVLGYTRQITIATKVRFTSVSGISKFYVFQKSKKCILINKRILYRIYFYLYKQTLQTSVTILFKIGRSRTCKLYSKETKKYLGYLQPLDTGIILLHFLIICLQVKYKLSFDDSQVYVAVCFKELIWFI